MCVCVFVCVCVCACARVCVCVCITMFIIYCSIVLPAPKIYTHDMAMKMTEQTIEQMTEQAVQ